MKILLKNLTKTYPPRTRKESPVTAVDNFDFEIPDGKLVALLGPSGCGKSTVLNMICGLLEPTSGSIFFGDDDVTDLPPEHRGVGMVFQNYALYPHLTVQQNITFPLENIPKSRRPGKEEMKAKALEVAKLVQIDQLMERKPKEMSGGQQQRVAIARALVKRPGVLLLDEPLSNLDARLRLQTREEIRRIQRETGITTIFVTHDQEEAMSISDMIVVMKEGVLQQIGRPQEVYDCPANLFVAKFLGTPPINVLEGSVREGMLYLGEDPVLKVKGAADQDVIVGIRPEGFIPVPEGESTEGAMKCTLKALEVMGRDVSVVSSHPAAQTETIRSIIRAEDKVDEGLRTVAFRLRPGKVFLFRKETEERLMFEAE
ncbi:MAG: ABC transporter ATP-binding protein [Lachnospiraceae bacterium]|nr:ABC transporter ATP-binding protein [Lachnospiraceae bacterium]